MSDYIEHACRNCGSLLHIECEPDAAAPAPTPQVGSVKCELAAPTEPVTPTEGERERAKDLCACSHCQAIMRPKPISCKAEAIAAALARTRAEAWEEAAQVLWETSVRLIKEQQEPRDQSGGVERASRNGIIVGIKMLREAAAIRAKGGR